MNYYIAAKKETDLKTANRDNEKMKKRIKKYMELLGEAVWPKQKD